MKRYILLIALAIGLWVKEVKAQSSLQQANQQYEMMAYSKAIELYELALKGNLADSTKLNMLIKLGHSYRHIRDTKNAERVYRAVTENKNTLPANQANCYLFFAQALASNGKYDEAKEVYERYNQVQQDDHRSKDFKKLYTDVSKLSKNVTSYTVEALDNINTNRADFSPTFYKKGLVFVSARNEGLKVKRVYSWNQTAFLDLYEIPDLSIINSKKTSRLGGSAATNKTDRARGVYLLGADEYTSPTANDSHIPGNYRNVNGTTTAPIQNAVIESQNMGKSINSKYHEGPVAFFKDGKKILFTRNNYLNGKYKTGKDGINKLKLYSAENANGNWRDLKELPFNSDEYSVGHPALSKDDKLLYFVSDMPGGFGGTDLYVSKYEGGNWTTPINLGPAVNSSGNEMFPFIDELGNLYFASDGHAGLGGLDIFYAKLMEGVMAKKPRNLGTPINSAKDDFGLITDGERKSGFFSSNRRQGGADDDLFRFERNGPLNPCQEVIVNVIDAETKSPLSNAVVIMTGKSDTDLKTAQTDQNGSIRLCLDPETDFVFKTTYEGYVGNSVELASKDSDITEAVMLDIPLEKVKTKSKTFTLRGLVTTQKDRKPIPGVKVLLHNECDGSVQEAVTDQNGAYLFEVPSGCDYSIEALKDNLGTMGSKVKGGETSEANITMFEKGDVIKIDNIYYDLDKYNIRSDAAAELNKLVELMNKYPKMKIEFGAHTDSRSSAKYNKKLSTNRAKAAVTYIVNQGVSSKRIIAAGYGESKLVNKCKDGVNCTEEEHQQNRRTEIKILSL
ncbi:OmpA family protein [Runella slithyformis]|uniref:OmpA/MotB domain protein n=1 Tax=Runella slithyformis (strain ATCC 29530 / DSM 19594 / LMG 11500 / NCIMB 11436 / LSU 4) TaxID=761193 RepID=A0A7U4E6P6_RUNSL|nr:OmpA family protein [Runella slithyformis]AEI49379.1 OmpA/MotB domain protein [Runella slithyformis DSM 19594]